MIDLKGKVFVTFRLPTWILGCLSRLGEFIESTWSKWEGISAQKSEATVVLNNRQSSILFPILRITCIRIEKYVCVVPVQEVHSVIRFHGVLIVGKYHWKCKIANGSVN